MQEYMDQVNAPYFYGVVALVLALVVVICVVFLVKSYRAGIKIGMDKQILRKAIISSATFTLLPSISILLGVIALSGSLGIPFSWLRLSVIGSLQYELNVAEIAAQSVGLTGLKVSELSMGSFVTIAFVMTAGILGGITCCVIFLKKYLDKVQAKPAQEKTGEEKPNFGAHATPAMFIGLCAAYIGSYVGMAMPREGMNWMPLFVAVIAGICMAAFEFLIQKKEKKVLENFSLAASMLLAMAVAVVVQQIL